MNSKKAKEVRRAENVKEAEAAAAVVCMYELNIKIYNNGRTSVSANNNNAIDDPILYLSIMSDANKAVLNRWHQHRETAKRIAQENESKIITL